MQRPRQHLLLAAVIFAGCALPPATLPDSGGGADRQPGDRRGDTPADTPAPRDLVDRRIPDGQDAAPMDGQAVDRAQDSTSPSDQAGDTADVQVDASGDLPPGPRSCRLIQENFDSPPFANPWDVSNG